MGTTVSFNRVLLVATFAIFSTFDIALVLLTQCMITLFLSLFFAGILRADGSLRQEVIAVIARELSPVFSQIAAHTCVSGEKIALIVRSTVAAVTGKTIEATSPNAIVEEREGVLTVEIPYRLRGADYVTYAAFDNTVSKSRKTYVVIGGERKQVPIHPGVIVPLTAEMLGADAIEVVDDDMETF